MFGFVMPLVIAQETHYQSGLDAYFERDYEAAKRHWLNGAKDDDARSMFNLGLLHEQRKISRADSVKANKWYRLAGKHGYPAADYHLASLLRIREGSSEEAQSLLERSAANGYGPARQALGLTVVSNAAAVNTISLSGESSVRVQEKTLDQAATPKQAAAPSQAAALKNTVLPNSGRYLGETWIKAQNRTKWTVQMLAFEELASVTAFIDEHGLNKNAAYFTERTDKGVLYKLIYGSYDSKEQADQARENLSKELKEYGPWLRPIENVQALLN